MKYNITVKVNENTLRSDTSYGVYKDEDLIKKQVNKWLNDVGIKCITVERISE